MGQVQRLDAGADLLGHLHGAGGIGVGQEHQHSSPP
jgi:hypothetical protein